MHGTFNGLRLKSIIALKSSGTTSGVTRGAMATAEDFYTFVYDSIDLLCREGERHPKMLSIALHCRLMGHPGRAAGLARLLDSLAEREDIWMCRRIDIARHWLSTHPYSVARAISG